MPDYFESRAATDAVESEQLSRKRFPIRPLTDGSSGQRFSNPQALEVLSATATPIPPTRLLLSAAPKCVSPRHEPSIGLFARPTGLGSAPLKSSVRSRLHSVLRWRALIRTAIPNR